MTAGERSKGTSALIGVDSSPARALGHLLPDLWQKAEGRLPAEAGPLRATPLEETRVR